MVRKKPVPKSREELIKSGLRMYGAMLQNKQKMALGEITEDDLYEQAAAWADAQIEKRTKKLIDAVEGQKSIEEEDEQYRTRQRAAYRQSFDWNDANDEASLEQLLDLEVQIVSIRRELEDPRNKDIKEKNSSRNALKNIIAEHRALQKSLQIDRESRETKRVTKSTIDDWERIKSDAKTKLDELAIEFSQYAASALDEAELRDRMKYHFAVPFDMVDAILINHRRVLGLDPTVQKS